MKAGDCCKGHGKCGGQAPSAHSHCGAPAVDPFTVEKTVASCDLATPTVAIVQTIAALVTFPVIAIPTNGSYAPPDLRILNSSLTI